MKKSFLPIVMAVAVAGYIGYQNNYSKFTTATKHVTPTQTQMVSPTVTPTSMPTTTLTTKPSAVPTNTPTPTPNPCPMGKPTPVTPDTSVRLESITPSSGKAGDTITIHGSGFGKSSFYFSDPTKFLGAVSFYGTKCGYNSGGAPPAENGAGWWSDNDIKVKVPSVSPGSFDVEVTSADGKRSNRSPFQITE